MCQIPNDPLCTLILIKRLRMCPDVSTTRNLVFLFILRKISRRVRETFIVNSRSWVLGPFIIKNKHLSMSITEETPNKMFHGFLLFFPTIMILAYV